MALEGNRTDYSRLILYPTTAFSLLAALIHLWAMPEHFEEWWGYGTFFLVAALAQGFYGAALLRWPRHKLLLLLGIGGNLSIIVLYLVTRTVGVPVFGPHAGEVEGVEAVGLCATMTEMAIVLTLGAVLLRDLPPQRRNLVLVIAAVAILSLGHLVHLLLRAWLWSLKELRHQSDHPQPGTLGITPPLLPDTLGIAELFVGLWPVFIAVGRLPDLA